MIKCNRCEKQFQPKSLKNTKYCSRECSDQKSIAVCYCATCGERFETPHIRKYCSDKCSPHNKPLSLKQRVCINCGLTYQPRLTIQKYCCRACNPYKKKESPGFYQSKQWKEIRSAFIASYTLTGNTLLSNKYCIECYRKSNVLTKMHAVDHIIRLKDGGTNEYNNLQSLCKHHHQSKSATEGNNQRKFGREGISSISSINLETRPLKKFVRDNF